MRPNDQTLPGKRHLAEFRGCWTLTRTITPARGPVAEFDGQAVWTPSGDDLAYEETGVLRLPGQPPIKAQQCHVWHPDLTVSFADGRPFHTVPPSGGATAHWCDPDHYEGVYDFADWPQFRVTWQVRGPRKAYVLRSLYRPAPRANASPWP